MHFSLKNYDSSCFKLIVYFEKRSDEVIIIGALGLYCQIKVRIITAFLPLNLKNNSSFKCLWKHSSGERNKIKFLSATRECLGGEPAPSLLVMATTSIAATDNIDA